MVAAHPDDETVGAASLLLRTPSAAVIHLTDGAPRDPRLRPRGAEDRAAYARTRRDEALAALAEAGLAAHQVIGLGATDQEAAHVLAPLARELAALLDRLRPGLVITHPFEGGHPDHDTAALVARAAGALLGRRGIRPPRLWEMTSYHLAAGGLATGGFLPGPAPVRVRSLGPPEREVKRRMLARYRSQAAVLAPFGLEEERFRRAGPVALATRPHPAPLLYEALGWTTFERFQRLARAGLEALGLAADGADGAVTC